MCSSKYISSYAISRSRIGFERVSMTGSLMENEWISQPTICYNQQANYSPIELFLNTQLSWMTNIILHLEKHQLITS